MECIIQGEMLENPVGDTDRLLLVMVERLTILLIQHTPRQGLRLTEDHRHTMQEEGIRIIRRLHADMPLPDIMGYRIDRCTVMEAVATMEDQDPLGEAELQGLLVDILCSKQERLEQKLCLPSVVEEGQCNLRQCKCNPKARATLQANATPAL